MAAAHGASGGGDMTAPSPQLSALAGAPKKYRSVLQRAFAGSSRSSAIHAFCLACVGFQREDVRNCSAEGCPLHPYRPYKPGVDPEKETPGKGGRRRSGTAKKRHMAHPDSTRHASKGADLKPDRTRAIKAMTSACAATVLGRTNQQTNERETT